jgi:uncharacterized protein YfiM (DUF2279 family)
MIGWSVLLALAPCLASPAAPAVHVPVPVRIEARHDERPAVRLAPPDADAWLGEDKVRHFTMSYAVVAVGFGTARAAGIERNTALASAAASAAAAGLLKEVYDRATGGIFSTRDLVWDAAGIIAGVLVLRQAR